MSSFSINSLLDIQDSKCGSSPANRTRKNAFAFQELEEQVISREYRDHRRSPGSSPSLETENASYEGKTYVAFYIIFPVCLSLGTLKDYFCRCVVLYPDCKVPLASNQEAQYV